VASVTLRDWCQRGILVPVWLSLLHLTDFKAVVHNSAHVWWHALCHLMYRVLLNPTIFPQPSGTWLIASQYWAYHGLGLQMHCDTCRP
jgi:hypothetical protein